MRNIVSINTSKFFIKNNNPFDTFIWLGKNYLQIAITDKDHNKVEALESYLKDKGNLTRNEALEIFQGDLVKKAERLFVGLESKKHTLIPSTFYSPDKKASYLQELFLVEQEEVIASQTVKPIECQSVFTIKKGTKDLISSELDEAQIFHAPSALLIAYQQMVPPNKEYISFVRLQQDEIFVTIFRNKHLQLHQSYSIENLDDAYYYYLNALDQLSIPRTQMTLSIFGTHSHIEDFKNILAVNLEAVKYLNRLPTLQYTDEVFSHPAHHFFNLFALLLCA